MQEKEEQRLEKIAARRVKESQSAVVPEQKKLSTPSSQLKQEQGQTSGKVSKAKKKGQDGKERQESINLGKKNKRRKSAASE